MNEFSIKQIESFTGIKAHTIRAWEQRYNFFKSKRTQSNIRYFTTHEVNILLKICFLNEQGYKLKNLDQMSAEEIDIIINEKILQNTESATVQSLILQTIELNPVQFEKTLDTQIQKNDFKHVLLDIIWPFMRKIGVLWNTTIITPRHEHMATEIIRRKIYAQLDKAKSKVKNKNSQALIFCVDNEFHDLPLISLEYILSDEGVQVLNLGAALPVQELQALRHKFDPKVIVAHMTAASCKSRIVHDSINKMAKYFPKSSIFITGQASESDEFCSIPPNVSIVDSVNDIKIILSELKNTR